MKPHTSITTGLGDKGITRLFSGEKVAKNALRMYACGELDELGSVLGVARCHVRRKETRQAIRLVQQRLLMAGSELATAPDRLRQLHQRIDAKEVKALGEKLRALEARIAVPRGFVIAGGTMGAAYLDHARAITRRCERMIVTLSTKKMVRNPNLLVWMNRLSDYLWLLARQEEGPTPRRKRS